MPSKLSLFLAELKRRKVDRVAALYAMVGLAVIEGANNLFPWLFIPTWANQILSWLVLGGFPVALMAAWFLKVTHEGSRETGAQTPREMAEDKTRGWTFGRSVVAVVVLVAVLAGGWFVFTRNRGPELEGDRIVVAPFTNLTRVDSLEVVSDIAAHWLTMDLQGIEGVEVVPANFALEAVTLITAGGVRNRIRGLAGEVGAGIVIAGSYVLERDSLHFRAEIIDAQARRQLAEVGPVAGPVDEPTATLEHLRQRVMGAVAAQVQQTPGGYPNDFRNPPSFAAYQAFIEANYHHFGSEHEEAVADYTRAFQLDSSFLEPIAASMISHYNGDDLQAADSIWQLLQPRFEELTPYYQLHTAGLHAWMVGDREESLRLHRRELEIYPGSVVPYSVAWIERLSNHPRRAVELLLSMDPERGQIREFFAYWSVLTTSYHMLGRHERELEEARRAEPLYRERLILPLRRQAHALAALGRVAELHTLLDRVASLPAAGSTTPGGVLRQAGMELRAHGHRQAAEEVFDKALAWLDSRPAQESETAEHRFSLARTLYGADRWEAARALAEELVAERPGSMTYQGFLGLVAAHQGDGATAEERARWLAELEPPFFPSGPLVWRARIASASGDLDGAMSLLRQAFDRGLGWSNRHPDWHSFEPLYGLPEYQELMRPTG